LIEQPENIQPVASQNQAQSQTQNQAPDANLSSEIEAGTTAPVKQLTDAVRREVAKAVVGQDGIITQFLMAILARGHVLLEGVPGVAKTLTAKAVAHSLDMPFRRIQFTPDLMPSDVVGTNVFDTRSAEFSLRQGPVFTGVLLADEINRTPPKTQAALLEAMQERHVTIDGERHMLPEFFTVFATQNPVEYEGTYPLPEAQVDRFLIKVLMTYPSPEEEVALLTRVHHGFDAHQLAEAGLNKVAGITELQRARAAVQSVKVSEGVLRYIQQIVARTRHLPTLILGGSPRAGIALLECSKALAAMHGRDYVIPEDVKTVAPPVLRHRLLMRAEAEMEGLRADDVVQSVVGAVEVPR
jgi:MoxR-like ATPase